MKAIRNLLFCVLVGGGLCHATLAEALTVQVFNDENDSLYSSVTKTFEAEFRTGDRSGSGTTYETRIGPTIASPTQQANFPHSDNNPYNFSLTYNGTTNVATFDVNTSSSSNTILNYTVLNPPTNGLYIRLFSNQSNESAYVGNLVLDGVGFGGPSYYTVGNGITNGKYLHILLTGSEFSNGFTLTGYSQFNWSQSVAADDLSYRFIGVNTPVAPVPVPAAVLLFGSGLAGLLAAKGRRLFA